MASLARGSNLRISCHQTLFMLYSTAMVMFFSLVFYHDPSPSYRFWRSVLMERGGAAWVVGMCSAVESKRCYDTAVAKIWLNM